MCYYNSILSQWMLLWDAWKIERIDRKIDREISLKKRLFLKENEKQTQTTIVEFVLF